IYLSNLTSILLYSVIFLTIDFTGRRPTSTLYHLNTSTPFNISRTQSPTPLPGPSLHSSPASECQLVHPPRRGRPVPRRLLFSQYSLPASSVYIDIFFAIHSGGRYHSTAPSRPRNRYGTCRASAGWHSTSAR